MNADMRSKIEETMAKIEGNSQALAMESSRGGDHYALIALIADSLHQCACVLSELLDGMDAQEWA